MLCTYCRAETHIINSRHQRRTNSTWRRRKCLRCGAVVTTIEQLDYEKSWRVDYPDTAQKRRNPASRPFLRDKLLLSVHQSLGHRPTALSDALALTHTIVGKIGDSTDQGRIGSADIANATLKALRRFDAAAATMYQAYHVDTLQGAGR